MQINYLKPLYLAAVLLYFVYGTPAAFAAGRSTITVLQPYTPAPQESAASRQQPDEPFITRTGHVLLAVDQIIDIPQANARGRLQPSNNLDNMDLVFSFFADQNIRISINSQAQSGINVVSLAGRQDKSSISTFSMSVAEDGYIISLQDLDTGMLYKVVGDTQTGIGQVTEVDLEQLPPVIDSEPLVPPQE